nr:hypothetical protein [uncultured Desulfobacter sp.]
MSEFLNLNQNIAQMAGGPIVEPQDTDQDHQDFGELYLAMRQQIPHVNAAYDAAKNIDADVPEPRRRERQRLTVLEAEANYLSAMEKPLAELESRLAAKENRILEEANIRPSMDPVISEMKAREVRDTLLSLKESERASMLMEAARNGHKAAIDAIKDSLLPIVGKEILERAEESYLRHHVPNLKQIREHNREALLRARNKTLRVAWGLRRAFNVPLSAQLPKKREDANA